MDPVVKPFVPSWRVK